MFSWCGSSMLRSTDQRTCSSDLPCQVLRPAPCASKLIYPSAETRSGRGLLHVVVFVSTMHHFRKKSSSTADPPPSPIVEHIKQELATFYPRTKDRRALAASSSAIALSIGSPSCDPIDTTPDEPGSSKESVWKAAYGAARMAVDIAKDSSDMLPPLKAVMVALSVFIKNYDVGSPDVSSHRLLTVPRSKPPAMGIRSEILRKGFSRLAGYSHTLSVTKTMKRKRGEKRSGGLCHPLQERSIHHSSAL